MVSFVRRVVAGYVADDIATRAASLAYFTLASMFPAILLLLTLLGHFISAPQAQERVVEIVGQNIPIPAFKLFVRENLHAALEWRGVMGVLGGLVLLWSSKGAFLAAERGINAAWHLPGARHTLVAYLVSIVTTVLLGILLVVQFSLIALLRTAVTWEIPVLGYSLERLSLLWSALSLFISPLMLFMIFLLLYTTLPRRRLPFRITAGGALFAALAYRICESGFIYYITYVAHMTAVYGAAAGLLVLMLWLYLASNIYFIGAELIYAIASERGVLTPPAP